MATDVLRPQDCLIKRIGVSPAMSPAIYHRRRCSYQSTKPVRKAVCRQPEQNQNQRKRFNQNETTIPKRSSSVDLKSSARNLVMGSVTILRRGESFDSKIFKNESVKKAPVIRDDEVIAVGTERLGPERPEMIPKQIGMRDSNLKGLFSSKSVISDVYAGSAAFSLSPSPSSLPLPSFSKKKQQASIIVDDSATRDLRRLLRLD
ncbi:hypothetical protein RJ641_004176 [Dillenia turbinata]|uniref:Uncharacterized protein n=1 Tax=Dillenia turbinata TaxID=194707 RepID=A0AAN8VIK5_9MAGN